MAHADTIDVMRSSSAPALDELRPHVAAALARMDTGRTVDTWATITVREIGLWQSLGLADTDEAMFECSAGTSPINGQQARCPHQLSLRNRTQLRGPHHLAHRNGPQVEERLLAAALYRPELDLSQ